MRYNIKRGNTIVANVRPEGQVSTKIMAEETVSMEFSLTHKIKFLTNDTVQVYGNTYYLSNEPVVDEISKREFHYTLQFVSVKYELSKVQCFYPDNQNQLTVEEWSAIADANTLIDLVVQNANRVQSGWSVGKVTATESKQVDFNSDNCLSALAKIAEAFKLEYWVDNNKSIHLEERKQISGYTFEYGKSKGLKEVTYTPLDNSNIVTRLYATGGEKNLPANYRNYSKKLRMSVPYLQKNTDKYGVIEFTKNFPEVFPKRIGTVTGVSDSNPLLFTDNTLDFDLNQTDANGTVILINGVSAKVKFNTGQLAGYTFEIKENGYNSNTKTFTLLKNKDERDLEVPSDLLRPAVGDEYVLFDIKMPQSYITNAETELQAKAQQYLDENCEQRYEYSVIADPFYFEEQNVNIQIGNTIHFINEAFDLDSNLRVISVTKSLQNPFDVEFELGEKATISKIVRNYIEEQKQAQIVKREQRYNAEMAKRSYNFAKEISDNVFDGEGYFDAQKIKPLSIETKMLTAGSRMQQLNLKDVILTVVNDNTAVMNTAGQLVHLTVADNPRTWNVPSSIQMGLGSQFHYIYAKAQRVGTNASILVSTNQIGVEDDPIYYHFEIGSLGSVENGFRRIKTNYGFSQFSPGELTTGRISSQNGQQYIDLKQDGIDIVGNIRMTSGSPAFSQIASIQDSKILQAKNDAKDYANAQVDAIEIESRNLLPKSNVKFSNRHKNFSIPHTNGKLKGAISAGGSFYFDNERDDNIVRFTIFFTTKEDNYQQGDRKYVTFHYFRNLKGGKWHHLFKSANYQIEKRHIEIRGWLCDTVSGDYPSQVRDVYIRYSSKDLGYTPAFEDIQEIINQSKQEAIQANEAYVVAQNFVTQVTHSADLDGVRTEAEQKAIDEATSKMLLAKEYADAKDVEKEILLKAYADGKISQAEQRAINIAQAKSNLAEQRAKAYADGKVTAEEQKRIADAQAKLNEAKLHAENLQERTRKTVDLRGVDSSKYYPVTFKLNTGKFYEISVKRTLASSYGIPAYSTHRVGFSCSVRWSTNASGWGTTYVQRIVLESTQRWASGAVFGNIGQMTHSSKEYIYLRGGSKYDIEVKGGNDVVITLHLSSYTVKNQTINILDEVTFPVTEVDKVKEKAETALQNAQNALNNLAANQTEINQVRATANSAKALADSISPKTAHIAMQSNGNAVMVGTMLYRSATQVMGGVTGVVDSAKDNVAQWHGAGYSFENRHKAPYRLTHDGKLYALEAILKGYVNAERGLIGGFQIQDNKLSSKIENNPDWIASNDPVDEIGNINPSSEHVEISPNKIRFVKADMSREYDIEIKPDKITLSSKTTYQDYNNQPGDKTIFEAGKIILKDNEGNTKTITASN